MNCTLLSGYGTQYRLSIPLTVLKLSQRAFGKVASSRPCKTLNPLSTLFMRALLAIGRLFTIFMYGRQVEVDIALLSSSVLAPIRWREVWTQ